MSCRMQFLHPYRRFWLLGVAQQKGNRAGMETTETALLLAWAQFAFTIFFHFLFSSFSIGLASYLAVLEGLWLWTKKQVYLDLFRY